MTQQDINYEYNPYYRNCNYFIVVNDKLITLSNRGKSSLCSFSLTGEKLSEHELDDNFKYLVTICPNDSTSFWVATYKRFQLFSVDLKPVAPIKSIDYTIPITCVKPGILLHPDDDADKLFLVDSTAHTFAACEFPGLKNYYLSLKCFPIDTATFVLLWTEDKDVYAQLFNSRLKPYGEKFMIHSHPEFYQDYAAACVMDDKLFCVWSDSRNLGHGYDVYGRVFDISTLISDVRRNDPTSTPDNFKLFSNYPNPFNTTTTISYHLPLQTQVEIRIYDVLGRCLKTLVDTKQQAGQQAALWDGRDQSENVVSSGVYFYRIKAGEINRVAKMVFLQ